MERFVGERLMDGDTIVNLNVEPSVGLALISERGSKGDHYIREVSGRDSIPSPCLCLALVIGVEFQMWIEPRGVLCRANDCFLKTYVVLGDGEARMGRMVGVHDRVRSGRPGGVGSVSNSASCTCCKTASSSVSPVRSNTLVDFPLSKPCACSDIEGQPYVRK